MFVNAYLWIVRIGSPWRDLHPQYGKFNVVHRRYKQWCDNHIWEYVLVELITEPDYEWLMIDASHCKVHPHGLWSKRRKPSNRKSKKGLNTKIHLVVDCSMPLRTLVTEGTRADGKMPIKLIEGMPVECLMVDRAYDTNALIEYLYQQGAQVLIPPKRNRTTKREYDTALYEYRHLVENTFLRLKQFRGIATRYVKSILCFVGEIHLASIVLWLRYLV